MADTSTRAIISPPFKEGDNDRQFGSSRRLKKIPAYWYPYHTMAKGRWLGREILEIVSTEFRDRSMEYYRYALESGVTTVNGKIAKPDTIIQDGDRIENIVHRHETPVTASPVRILLEDKEREFIVIDKPGSIPVHPTGRYFKNSLSEIMKEDFGYDKVYTVNRLDRLTSGLMILALSPACARTLSDEFVAGRVKKEYIARVRGCFPEEETTCEQPLLCVDRQMGLNIVHPEGKDAKTIFKRLHYDANTDSSVLHCRPLTGRSHQIRVHLQYLGYPIANDPIYSETRIWGPALGKNGIDVTPSEERTAPAPPSHLSPELSVNPESSDFTFTAVTPTAGNESGGAERKLLPRETGHDIGMGSPVPLSAEAVKVITSLRNMKDEDEDWGRWRDVVFLAKARLAPQHVMQRRLPPSNRRERGGPGWVISRKAEEGKQVKAMAEVDDETATPVVVKDQSRPEGEEGESEQLTTTEALSRLTVIDPDAEALKLPREEQEKVSEDVRYCPECYLPLHPDPKPEKLYIFLHALRYTTSLGVYETEMPEWAAVGWEWDRSG
ncbi:pseudouridine synthase [Heliocybe sulcata]|uniref:Pseudouridine synthase n=1 Tax=Heliocybe sulcata TaxID=5364 RepID=A0A5C3NA53_9AGAM|nr:pseudouridine synthase [Heliocybe sulcata]